IWHYTVDASLVGMFLVRSDNLYFKISGVIVGLAAVAPLLFSLASYLKRGEFEAVEDLQNSAEQQAVLVVEPVEEQVAVAPSSSRYEALSSRALATLAICLVIGVLAAWKLDRERIGDYLKLRINTRQAAALAEKELRGRGVDPSRYQHATMFLDNSDSAANE